MYYTWESGLNWKTVFRGKLPNRRIPLFFPSPEDFPRGRNNRKKKKPPSSPAPPSYVVGPADSDVYGTGERGKRIEEGRRKDSRDFNKVGMQEIFPRDNFYRYSCWPAVIH